MVSDMSPKVIIHNSISLDGSISNFDVNMGLHYQLGGMYKPDAHLIGSNTIKIGIELYGSIHREETKDFHKPERDENLPYWVIIDTKGTLQNLLHEVRRFEYCKDVILLLSKRTPECYIEYLSDRNYDFHYVGNEHVDLKKSLEFISKKYNIKTLITDCGKVLGNLLLNQGLVDEISLLVHPVIVGDNSYNVFGNVIRQIQLKLLKNEIRDGVYIWQVYKVLNV